MKTKHVSVLLPVLALALALGSGCSTFHGYETSLPEDVKPDVGLEGRFRIAEMSCRCVSMDGSALPGSPETSGGESAMNAYLAEKFPETFSTDDSATPLVVRQTIAHGPMESNVARAFVGSFLTLGCLPSTSIVKKRMTTAFLLPSEETTEPYEWEVRINHLYNVNFIASAAYRPEDGWYRGYPLEASFSAAGPVISGTRDPVIAADFTADKEFGDKVLDGIATAEDHDASRERVFWRQVSPEVGTARWREYAGAAIVEALNRLSSEEKSALKNNLAARTAAADASLLDGLFSDYPLRKPVGAFGRDAILGKWEGENKTETLNSGFAKEYGMAPRISKHVRSVYEFREDGTYVATVRADGASESEQEGKWSYANGILTTEIKLPGTGKPFSCNMQVAWFGPDEFELREIAGTRKVYSATTVTTVEENGVYTSTSSFGGGMKTVVRGTPTALKRAK